MKKTFKRTSAFVCAMAVMAAPMTFSSFVANAEGETVTSDYTLTIPATLAVENSGWNSIGDLTATGTLAQSKKLNVTATSENSWKLTSGENTVAYKLCGETEKTKTYADAAAATSLDISKESLEQTGGFSVPIGIVVEDYSSKPAGDYSDTVTFTAKVENAGIPVESVAINNAPTEALFVNSTGTLTATVSPNNATDKTVVWSSSDPDYVSINAETGEYTIMGTKGYGSATITATATNGTEDTSDDVTATCTITGKVHHTSLQAGDIIRVGETIYTGGSWSVDIKPSTSFGTSAGVITLVENETNGKLYYKFNRGSNNTKPNWTSFKVTDNTDGLYIVSGTGTSSDKFTLAVHTK